jgi:selenocysteine lyase/cysteine desulfurase
MKDITKIRENFPYLKTGKIYLNHAATGPIIKPVKDKLIEVISEKSETEIDNFKKFLNSVENTKLLLGELINTSSERIAFVDNTSTGLNILAQGIDWEKGDGIILNNLEFPANVYPFLNLNDKGVEVDFVKSHKGIVTAENIIDAIKPNTKLISLSMVQFLTGYRIDLEKIGKVCKEKNIIFSVDAIQGLGAVRLNVQKCNVDFVSSGSQKWLFGLQGLGFIYLSERLQSKIKPTFVGWTSVENQWNLLNYDLILKKTAERFQTGTLNTLGIFALEESLKFLKNYGFDLVEKKVLDNSTYLMQLLNNLGIKTVLTNLPEENISGIVSFEHKNSSNIFNTLLANNIICSIREGMIRFSPHFYNLHEELEKVIKILAEVL